MNTDEILHEGFKRAFKGQLKQNGNPLSDDNPLPVKVIYGGGGGASIDREVSTILYRCLNTFGDSTIGDIVSATRVLDVSGEEVVQVGSTIWFNETTAQSIPVPASTDIQLVQEGYLTENQLRSYPVDVNTGFLQPLTDTQLRASAIAVSTGLSQPLTDTQLRASAVSVAPNITRGSGTVDANTQRVVLASDGPTVTNLTNINTAIGAKDDAAATTDAGTFSLIALTKRLLQKWTSGLSVFGTIRGPISDQFLRPANTTAYAANATIANATSSPATRKFTSIFPSSGGTGYINITANVRNTSMTARLRIHLFSSDPAVKTADGVAFVVDNSDESKYLGYVDLDAMNTGVAATSVSKPISVSTADVFYQIQTLDGFTPASSTSYTFKAFIDSNV